MIFREHKVNVSLMAFIVYLTLFIVWRKLQPDGIIFFQGLVLAFLVVALQLILQMRKPKYCSVLKDAVITFLVCYCFMFTVPTTVDRSYSVRMIMELREHPEGLSQSQIEHSFAGYFMQHGGVQTRLNEQLATGSIVENGERYELTTRGVYLANTFEWFRAVFSIRRFRTE